MTHTFILCTIIILLYVSLKNIVHQTFYLEVPFKIHMYLELNFPAVSLCQEKGKVFMLESMRECEN